MGICERILVLNFGVTIAEGTLQRFRPTPKSLLRILERTLTISTKTRIFAVEMTAGLMVSGSRSADRRFLGGGNRR